MKRLIVGALLTLGLTTALAGGNDPTKLPSTISRSPGVAGGVVLLWPRIIPASDDPQTQQDASFVQSQFRAAIARALPNVPVDIRPAPERVCPQKGCDGVAVGAVMLHRESGCAVVATISKPGQSDQRLVAMAGAMSLSQNTVPFRVEPESFVTVHDFDRCVDLGPNLDLRMAAFDAAIREAFGVTGTDASGAPAPTRVVIGGGG